MRQLKLRSAGDSRRQERRFGTVQCGALLIALGLAAAGRGLASPAPGALWVPLDAESVATDSAGDGIVSPSTARHFVLDEDALDSLLARAPMELTARAAHDPAVIELPLPDGRLERFAFSESPVMHPELGAKYPEIRTYKGVGLDHPADLVRFDRTTLGFHAMILSPSGDVFIDPLRRDAGIYQSRFKRDFAVDRARPSCLVEESAGQGSESKPGSVTTLGTPVTFRTYRLAMAATGEYSVAICNYNQVALSVANSLAGIVTTVNRINQVYERDLAVRMVLVANNDQIIYLNGSTDPYINNNPTTALTQNQSNLTNVIGSANYDIGHLFSTGTGGVAGLGVACVDSNKARGTTGISEPVGDEFDIRFVAHEIGHQFGANHTFNGTIGSCGTNRSASHAYEVGSGSTVMGFAGLCSSQDLQPLSDDYFHLESINEITAYITTGTGTCSSNSAPGNLPPTVDAGAAFTIPSRTPFALTATGSDPDGDPLTYDWEEFDLGAAGSGTTDNGASPILRSFPPTIQERRGFPKLANLANGTTTYGEVLPTTSRTMNFRVTARDNSALGGGTDNDATTVTSVAVAGPFQITSQNTATSWTFDTQEVVTWDVAGTDANGINATAVRITLSLNGGRSFPYVLAPNVPNDGSETISVPDVSTTTGRIQVEAVGNIFFDMNNAAITVTGGSMIFADGFETGDTLDWSLPAP